MKNENIMTPKQYIKQKILAVNAGWEGKNFDYELPAETIDKLYQELIDRNEHWDAKNEVRYGEVETDQACDGGRNYEAKSVAFKTHDDKYVGWTHYYGGGKHSNPEAIEWIDKAYFLDCKEEEKVVIIQTFTKK
jgi:hypothetical protein